MSVDIDLVQILEDVSITSIKTESDIVRYICNYAFADVLDPCKNTKFPGTMVVSLCRNDIPTIVGRDKIHRPYSKEEIVAWINPVQRQIPPLNFQTNEKPSNKMKAREKKIRFNTNNIEFGNDLGYFNYINPIYIDVNKIDFGSETGYFVVY
jgi:hypothetical protein